MTIHKRFASALAALDQLAGGRIPPHAQITDMRQLICELYAQSRELDLLKSATRAYLAAAANPLADSPKITHDTVDED